MQRKEKSFNEDSDNVEASGNFGQAAQRMVIPKPLFHGGGELKMARETLLELSSTYSSPA